MREAITLPLGEEYHLRRGKDRIRYAGMPSDTVYSIVQRKGSGYQGFAWNLFFPIKKQSMTIDGVSIFVENITPEEIRFRIQ